MPSNSTCGLVMLGFHEKENQAVGMRLWSLTLLSTDSEQHLEPQLIFVLFLPSWWSLRARKHGKTNCNQIRGSLITIATLKNPTQTEILCTGSKHMQIQICAGLHFQRPAATDVMSRRLRF